MYMQYIILEGIIARLKIEGLGKLTAHQIVEMHKLLLASTCSPVVQIV